MVQHCSKLLGPAVPHASFGLEMQSVCIMQLVMNDAESLAII